MAVASPVSSPTEIPPLLRRRAPAIWACAKSGFVHLKLMNALAERAMHPEVWGQTPPREESVDPLFCLIFILPKSRGSLAPEWQM